VAVGSEEYLDSEKYELKQRALDGPLLPLVQRLNEIRRAEPALQRFENCGCSTRTASTSSRTSKGTEIAAAVNLDPRLPERTSSSCRPGIGLPDEFPVLDLLTGEHYRWRIGRNYVGLARRAPRPKGRRMTPNVQRFMSYNRQTVSETSLTPCQRRV
jgi:starch synthase (maltosyl-transferring)